MINVWLWAKVSDGVLNPANTLALIAAAITTLVGNGTSVIQGLVMELITTSVLTLAVLVLAFEKHGGFNAAFGMGSSLLISILLDHIQEQFESSKDFLAKGKSIVIFNNNTTKGTDEYDDDKRPKSNV
ncbi:15518_t:CDS:2 [Funneliformis caledonium]|uniref:15518_t:CDS:1 n=1 Tax=Funneliformis caledonium TaxID=1117310 RepID=A0A9N8V4M1_9GLOM|nr:15518_t:CDS:2 [Funneliformis caledonium]